MSLPLFREPKLVAGRFACPICHRALYYESENERIIDYCCNAQIDTVFLLDSARKRNTVLFSFDLNKTVLIKTVQLMACISKVATTGWQDYTINDPFGFKEIKYTTINHHSDLKVGDFVQAKPQEQETTTETIKGFVLHKTKSTVLLDFNNKALPIEIPFNEIIHYIKAKTTGYDIPEELL